MEESGALESYEGVREETRETKPNSTLTPVLPEPGLANICFLPDLILFASCSLQSALLAEKAHIQSKVGRMCPFLSFRYISEAIWALSEASGAGVEEGDLPYGLRPKPVGIPTSSPSLAAWHWRQASLETYQSPA